ncbi:MAG TPA: hypothetical protein VGK17_08100 [Propionicimonas sp.]|jgi:hypothetical protein
MKPLPTDVAEYHRRRRAARIVTLVVLLVALRPLYRVVLIGSRQDESRAFAMVPYVQLVIVAILGGIALVTVWRRSFHARPVTLSLDPTPGEIYGIPQLDEPPARHRGLSGEVEPPVRW